MKRFLLMTIAMFFIGNIAAQKTTLTKEEQANLKEETIILVDRFQSNCALIGSDKSYHEKTRVGGIIDVAMKDFRNDSIPMIEITSLNGKSKKSRPVRDYLMRLAMLKRNLYKEIQITWFDLRIPTDFKKDPNNPGYYVCTVALIQRFSALTREMNNVEDLVVRNFNVYATQEEYQKGNVRKKRWRIYLGDIEANAIQ